MLCKMPVNIFIDNCFSICKIQEDGCRLTEQNRCGRINNPKKMKLNFFIAILTVYDLPVQQQGSIIQNLSLIIYF